MVKSESPNWIIYVLVLSIACAVVFASADAKRTINVGRMRNKSSNPNVRRKGFDQPMDPEPPKAPTSSAAAASAAASSASAIQPNIQIAKFHSGSSLYSSVYGTDQKYSGYASRHASEFTNIEKIPTRNGNIAPLSSPPTAAANRALLSGTAVGSASALTSFKALDSNGPASIGAPSYVKPITHANGFSGLSGTYGPNYGYGQISSNPNSFGNLLSGLALWNMAREFNSYHSSHQDQLSNAIGIRNQEAQFVGDTDSTGKFASAAVATGGHVHKRTVSM